MKQFVDENNYPLFDGLVGLKQNTMQTAMQKLLLKLATQTEKDSFGRRIIQLSIVDKEIVEALEKEKEQLQKAFSDGQETPINHPTLPHYSREEYYNDNYNPNK